MKKLLTIAFLLCSILQAVAETWTDSNGIIWSFSVNNGDAVGVHPYDKSSITGDLVIPEIMNSYPVMSIANDAFYQCNNLTNVSIPNNVTRIGERAFSGCKNLATITLPSSLVTIDNRAFYSCEKLENLNLPSSLETIGEEAFVSCNSLTTLTIPGSVETIGRNAFQNCYNIENLTISEGVNSIGSGAFGGLKISSVNIPKSVTQLPYPNVNPFYFCRNLETITVDADNPNYYSQNNSLIERSTNTLVSASINTVIPNGINIIGNSAFYGLPIETISIPNTVTTIGNSAFSNCEELVSITIPSSVTKIDNYAFSYCPKIESIKLSSGLKTIGNGAFWTNSNYLTSMIIPEGVTTIGSQAFQDCYALKFVSLPSSLTSLFNSAFYGCNNLSEVEVNTISPLDVDQYSFPNRTNAKLYVPAGSKAAYQAAQYWTDFKNINEVGYIGDVDSELTGETGIACFVVNRTGKLGNYFVQAGTPRKVKIIGEVDANDLRDLYSYDEYYTDYVDLSEAHINGCTYSGGLYGTKKHPDDYLESDWMGGYDDDSWYGPRTIVLPMTLEEFVGAHGCYYIYSEQTIPFKTTIYKDEEDYYKCKFYVPSGTRISWIEQTTRPEDVMFVDGPSKNVQITTAGTLASLLTENEIASLNELSISGHINAKDFSVLKRMNNLVKLSVYAIWESYQGNEGPVEGQTSYQAGEVPAFVFQNHSNLEDVRLSISYGQKGLLVGDYAFDGCSRLKNFTCEGFSSLGDFCFRNTKVKGALLLGTEYDYYEDSYYEGTGTENNREFEHIGLQPFFGVEGTSSPWQYARLMSERSQSGNEYIYNLDNFTVIPDYNTSFGGYGNRPYFSGVTNKSETLLYALSTTQDYNLTLPSSITTLADYAVSGLQLRSINLNSVTTIGDAFLYQCPLLQSITCNNTAYKSVDGVLYTAEMNMLVKYPCAKTAEEFIIPSTVEQIGKWAFEGAENLTTIVVKTATPPVLADLAFDDFDATTVTLYVPSGSLSAYQAADGWNQFDLAEYVTNDVNMDGETDVVDVVDIARYVVGTPAETFVKVLADINSDGGVDIGDAVTLVNEIAGDQNFARAYNMPKGNTEFSDELTLTESSNSLSLCLANQRYYTAFQFDLYVPEGVDVMQIQINKERKQKHQLLYNKVENGHWRVVALSTSNRTFEGNNGELLNVALGNNSSEGISLSNIKFFDAKGSGYQFNDLYLSGTTMIQSKDDGQWTTDNSSTVYDLQGRKMVNGKSSNCQLPRGVYIVNGKKVMIK